MSNNPFLKKPKWGQMEISSITPMSHIKEENNPSLAIEVHENMNGTSKNSYRKYIIPLVIIFGCLIGVALVAIIIMVVKSRCKKKSNENAQPSK